MGRFPIDAWFESARRGDSAEEERLAEAVYRRLVRIAEGLLAREPRPQLLQAEELVSEAWLRLFGSRRVTEWEDAGRFVAAVRRTMRSMPVSPTKR